MVAKVCMYVCNFADDNTHSFSDISVEQIICSLESDIDVLQQWFTNNGMLLNETKYQFLIIESLKNTRDKTAEIKIQNKTITESTSGKLLGITIDNNLTMNDHIKHLCKQAGNKLNALARIGKYG